MYTNVHVVVFAVDKINNKNIKLNTHLTLGNVMIGVDFACFSQCQKTLLRATNLSNANNFHQAAQWSWTQGMTSIPPREPTPPINFLGKGNAWSLNQIIIIIKNWTLNNVILELWLA